MWHSKDANEMPARKHGYNPKFAVKYFHTRLEDRQLHNQT